MHECRLSRRNCQRIMNRRFSSYLGWIHSLAILVNDGIIDTVLYIRRCVFQAVQPAPVGFVFRKQQRRRAFDIQPAFAIARVAELYHLLASSIARLHERTWFILVPGPSISKPDRREQIQGSQFRPAVSDADANENVLAIGLRVLHEDVEVAIVIKYSRIQQLVFGLLLATTAIFLDQSSIRILPLRILLEVFHVG